MIKKDVKEFVKTIASNQEMYAFRPFDNYKLPAFWYTNEVRNALLSQ